MKLRLRGCPRADELLAFAQDERVPSSITRHIARCDTCAQLVEYLRRDAKLISELRAATSLALEEDVQRDVLNACRSALKDPAPDKP